MIGHHSHIVHLKSVRGAIARSCAGWGTGRTVGRARVARSRAAVIGIRARSTRRCTRLPRNLDLVSYVGRKIVGAPGQGINRSGGTVGKGVTAGRAAQTTGDGITCTARGGAASAALI